MKFIDKLKSLRHKFYIWYFCRKPIKRNKIILWADSFKHFGCSPKYIALYLIKNYPNTFDLVWVFEESVDIPDDMPKAIRVVRYFSIDYLKELHTAKFVICNMRTGQAHMWHKRSDQIYIQTWHSSLRLKKIEGDALDNLGEDYVKYAKEDSKKIDLLLSGCEFSTEIFKRSFWYNGEILKNGTPRCDILVKGSGEIRYKVFARYGFSKGVKFALYAPTFRKEKKADVLGMDFKRLKTILEKTTGKKWEIGCRMHPNILEKLKAEDCVNVSDYSDMQELLCAADILITDYSSCMFDMAIANKPCVLFVPDLDNYLSTERGLYFDIEKLPFPIARNMEELDSVLDKFDFEKYRIKLKEFKNRMGSYERGTASASIAEFIIRRT